MRSLRRPTLSLENFPGNVLRAFSMQKSNILRCRFKKIDQLRLLQLKCHVSRKAYTLAPNPTGSNGAINPRVMFNTHQHSSGGTVGTITISNPAKLNIVNSELLAQTKAACEALSD